MEWRDVRRRIEAGEDRRTEFKRGLWDLSAICRAMCAFANTEGGVIIVGVEDSREVTGVREDAERVQERLTSFLQTGCSQPVHARTGRREEPAGRVHWIDVPRQRGFEPLRYDGRVWVRRERSSVEPSATELQELYNAFGYILTEEQTIAGASVSDIELAAFRTHLTRQGFDVVAEPQPAVEDDLRNRGVLAEFDGALHPTLYGLLAFGKHPQLAPQTGNFWIECVAYGGNDQAADVILVSEAKGRLDEQLDRALGWARGLGRFEQHGEAERKDTTLLPLTAIREALVNAIGHRDYAITGSKILLEVFFNRVVVTSPGALLNHMTVAAVQTGGRTRSRNEQMANYMLDRRYMERRGRGWLVMRNAMQEFNGTEPTLDHDAQSRFVTVTFSLTKPG